MVAYELLVILILVLINGILSGSEIAVVAIRSTRIQELVAEGGGAAKAVRALRKDPERFLATVQIGITVVGAAAAAFGGSTFAKDLTPHIAAIPGLASRAETIAFVIVVALISYFSVVLGELVPKSLALRYAERYALIIGRPMVWLSWLARPLVWTLTVSSNVILRLFGDSTTFTEARLSPDELQRLVDEAAKSGTVDPHAGKIASRALDFADLTAEHVMVPRRRVVALPIDAGSDLIRKVVLERGHSRLPVYEGSLDNVVGYVTLRDIVAISWERPLFILRDFIRPVYFVTEAMRAVELLNEMRRRRIQFAVVVDEDGGVAGIVTLEDLVEELVGDIFSERDAAAPERIRMEPDGAAFVLGDVPVRTVNRELDIELPEGESWSTIAGLCLELAGRIPEKGEVFTAPDGTSMEIVEATPRHIRAVRVRKGVKSEDGAEDEA
ncbi:MAG: HlyC/CorC family transporter [Polyangiaceae bacterium]|nr:HlyC/CorC family transporter [Polyangiaceae bacterium]